MTWLAIAAVVVLALVTLFSFAHASSSKLSDEELRKSNARVLTEFRKIAVYRPEQIVDYQNRGSRVDT